MAVAVAGTFSISMEVRDIGGTPLLSLSASDVGATHQIEVENISQLPRRVRCSSVLPTRTVHLEFLPTSGTPSDWWTDDVPASIPPGNIGYLHCGIRRNGGPNTTIVPIELVEVQDKIGGKPWKRVSSSNVPFQISVGAA
ncbi:hypothetical protein [Paraburkholderia sp. MM5477-R1]|uniref:hypothetical protein n=1 Tax=Paraburkholderia sp. MM5477-R1 TaxID=2991062 RepID=UPI003D20C252